MYNTTFSSYMTSFPFKKYSRLISILKNRTYNYTQNYVHLCIEIDLVTKMTASYTSTSEIHALEHIFS